MTGLVKPCPGCGTLRSVRKDGGIRQHGGCNGWTPREHRTTPFITDTHMQARIEQARALGWSLLHTCESLGVDAETVLLVWEAQDLAVAEGER